MSPTTTSSTSSASTPLAHQFDTSLSPSDQKDVHPDIVAGRIGEGYEGGSTACFGVSSSVSGGGAGGGGEGEGEEGTVVESDDR